MTSEPAQDSAPLAHLPLDALHRELGARMTPFAGYDMPLQYAEGIVSETRHTRQKAGLFDVSHMGQAILSGTGAAQALESLCPADLASLQPGRMRYTQLLNERGGIIDDLMVTRLPGAGERLLLVVNAARKAEDFALIQERLPQLDFLILDRALVSLQGPRAAAALDALLPGVSELAFLHWRAFEEGVSPLFVSRSGYTGEDGFEVVVPAEAAVLLWHDLVAQGVRPCGLGARDTLRLEAGMNLYGQDMDDLVTPDQAGLTWTVSLKDSTRDFVGRQALEQVSKPMGFMGIKLLERGVMRSHMRVRTSKGMGEVTSGTMSPTLGFSIGFARLPSGVLPGEHVEVDIRGKWVPAQLCKLPFVRNGQPVVHG